MKILVTGGAGFIGSNFIRLLINETRHQVVCLDCLTYAGNLENLADIPRDKRYRFAKGDIRDRAMVEDLIADGVDALVNFAAESHVDRSITDPQNFLQTNYFGCASLLDAARKFPVKVFLQVSTDEVYGPVPTGLSKESHILNPSSPYSASKAASDLLCLAYHKTYGLPVLIARMSNNYGPYQFPEKLIPLFITNALDDQPLPIYGDGKQERDWIFVEDACLGLLAILEEGKVGEVYNLGGGDRRANLEVTQMILKELKKPKKLVKHINDRPGHDRRYALDCHKLKNELNFEPGTGFELGLKRTVKWYMDNKKWWQRVKSGEYLKYYETQYGQRLDHKKSPKKER
jgi:dTDP-glucose 4,6-dehydratase